MRIKSLLTLLALVLLVSGLMLSLSGCSGGSSPPSSVPEPVAADTSEPAIEDTEPADITPVVEEPSSTIDPPVEETAAPSATAEAEPSAEPDTQEEAESPAEADAQEAGDQPILTWTRTAGGLSHCDRLSVFSDGRVEAVVCRGTASEPIVHATLTEAQLTQLQTWVAEYAELSRREMEMSFAVRTTTLFGEGTLVAELEVKKEIATFAADIYFGLTDSQ
ncbi:hypothetical protein ACFLSZ_02925 [Candidatus Bipolaricaulota bacterium]